MKKYWIYILLSTLLYFPLFQSLDSLTLRVWDEARIAVNSECMYENKDYLVTHFFSQPEMWNLKPPLLNWLQNICFHFVGVNELGVRLPIAIASFLTCLALFAFFRKYFKNSPIGFMSALILVSTTGYVSIHGTRTGDYDALLTLFTTLYCFTFYLYCITARSKYIFLTFVFITLACMTKSVAGLFLAPALFLFVISTNKILPLLKNKYTWFGLLFFIVCIVGYYLIRDHYNKGYLTAVLNDTLFMASSSTSDHNETWSYYFINLIFNNEFSYWIYILPLGILSIFFQKNIPLKRFSIFSLLVAFTFLLVISFPKYKCEWYAMPIYPWLAIITAIGIYTFYEIIFSFGPLLKWKKTFVTLFFLIILYYPYKEIFVFTYKPKEDMGLTSGYTLSSFLKNSLNTPHIFDNYIFLFGEDDDHIYFYLNLLQQAGSNVTVANYVFPLPDNTKVFLYGENAKEFVKHNYDYTLDNVIGNVEFLTLKRFNSKE